MTSPSESRLRPPCDHPASLWEVSGWGWGEHHGRAAKDKMNSLVTDSTMELASGQVQMAAFDPPARERRGKSEGRPGGVCPHSRGTF